MSPSNSQQPHAQTFDIDRIEQILNESTKHFGLTDAQHTLVSTTNNIIYRLDSDHERYILRIHQPGKRKQEWIESELTWLNALCHETNLHVPKPAASIFTSESGDYPTCCTLLHWLDGEQILPSKITSAQAQKVGSFTAQLHNHSANFIAPPNFTLPQLNIVERLQQELDSKTKPNNSLITPDQHNVLKIIAQGIHLATTNLGNNPNTFGIIHADLIWKNILFHKDAIGAIDFDECAYGHYLYDLAPILLGYMDEPNYPEIRAAVLDGYMSIHTLPTTFSDVLATLIAGRYALSCLWIAANQHNPAVAGRAPEIIAQRIAELERYLTTGKFRRGEIIV